MLSLIPHSFHQLYERVLRREIGAGPTHVAIIQDGNRRYARKQGADAPDGHREGAETSEQVLNWCEELGIEELTLYAFSTENFDRPADELKPLFDIIESKLYELADSDRVHDTGVCIRAIGDISRLPERVQTAISYAEAQTREYSHFQLNVALAYGGRNELLRAARAVVDRVDAGGLAVDEIDVSTIEDHLYRQPIRDVDLIIRTGGDERTSNFLPWHANGNEAAVYFCAPYWPEFSKIDFLRGIRTYEAREESWQQTKLERALTVVRSLGDVDLELDDLQATVNRLREIVPEQETQQLDAAVPVQRVGERESTAVSDDPETTPAD